MTRLAGLADCVLSGQVDAACIVALCAANPGLRAELERRSCASPAHAGQTGQGGVSVSPTSQSPCLVDPLQFNGQPALSSGSGQEVSRDPLKARGLLSQFFSSFHLRSFQPRKLWRL